MQWTYRELGKRGVSAAPLQKAYLAVFDKADRAHETTIQLFWDEFVVAHRVIFGGDKLEVAA